LVWFKVCSISTCSLFSAISFSRAAMLASRRSCVATRSARCAARLARFESSWPRSEASTLFSRSRIRRWSLAGRPPPSVPPRRCAQQQSRRACVPPRRWSIRDPAPADPDRRRFLSGPARQANLRRRHGCRSQRQLRRLFPPRAAARSSNGHWAESALAQQRRSPASRNRPRQAWWRKRCRSARCRRRRSEEGGVSKISNAAGRNSRSSASMRSAGSWLASLVAAARGLRLVAKRRTARTPARTNVRAMGIDTAGRSKTPRRIISAKPLAAYRSSPGVSRTMRTITMARSARIPLIASRRHRIRLHAPEHGVKSIRPVQ